MPFTTDGKHYAFRAKRWCKKCREQTEQMAATCSYSAPTEPKVPEVYIRTRQWVCEVCNSMEVEEREITEPSDKAKIFNRLLRIPDDYNTLDVTVTSLANEIVYRIRLPDFDISEVRAIKTKAEQTGFITVNELMQVQKAGFKHPRDVPPKPEPKDRGRLRERAKQKMFIGEPRSI